VNEELEHSLQQAVETYVNERLRTIDEQLSKLQTDVNEALSHLREKSGAESIDGTALSASIFAHLQTARGQKLSGVTLTPPAVQESRTIRRATEEIEKQSSQSDILRSLLICSSQFAERVALFVIKNDQAIGWRACRASDTANLEMIGGVSLPLSSETIVTRAAQAKSAKSEEIRSNPHDQLLIDQLRGEPHFASAMPLIVRGKVVAVLYADSASADANAINSDALEILARVASMAVGLGALHRAAPASPEAPAVSKQPETVATPGPETAAEPESTYTPQVEPQNVEAGPPALAEEQFAPEAAAPPPAEIVSETAPQESVAAAEEQSTAATEEQRISEAPAVAPESQATSPEMTAAPPPPSSSEPSSSPFLSDYVTPLGGARRFGVSEPELPIDVSEEERRLHNDARRYARLLVSEIKLYNEPKVKEGRNVGDLYDRLREDIDRSRQMYDKRVAPPVAARHDYFHQELVNMLAEGDAAKLGASYPGAA
jgi:hypothetical protein